MCSRTLGEELDSIRWGDAHFSEDLIEGLHSAVRGAVVEMEHLPWTNNPVLARPFHRHKPNNQLMSGCFLAAVYMHTAPVVA